uniref:Cation efflux protein transmembrane domain-containing protein n=1 Tax=Monopterus albus TaxID=43700 RepID=A0A3Q3IC42_MONAL
ASSADARWRPGQLCQDPNTTSGADSDTRHLARRKLLVACTISLVFMTGELIGGYAAHSLAIMTDTVHLTHTMTFGWHRAEILGMLLSVMTIWAVTVVLVLSAIHRIADGDYNIDIQIMLITSGCAVAEPGTSHSHSHRHRHAAFIHMVGHLMQSIGVLLAATIIHFWVSVNRNNIYRAKKYSDPSVNAEIPQGRDRWTILYCMFKITANHYLKKCLLVSSEEDADMQIVLSKATELLCLEFGFSSITIQVERQRTEKAQ